MIGRSRPHIGISVADAPGPLARVAAVVPHLRSQVTVLSSADPDGTDLGEVLRVRLPRRDEGLPGLSLLQADAASALGREGAGQLLAWMQQEDPDLLLVDGPADAAVIARLCDVPVVVLRRHGVPRAAERELVDRGAAALLAPYPTALAPHVAPEWVRARTVHTGVVTRFAGSRYGRTRARDELGLAPDARVVTVVAGRRGLGVDDEVLRDAATATPGWHWIALGDVDLTGPVPDGLILTGWVDDPRPYLSAADVVVGGASISTLAEVACAGVPFLVLPRPTDEGREEELVGLLGSLGAAVPLDRWPSAEAWPDLLEQGRHVDTSALRALCDGRGPQRMAQLLDTWAAEPASAPGYRTSPAPDHHQPTPAGNVGGDLVVLDEPAAAGSNP